MEGGYGVCPLACPACCAGTTDDRTPLLTEGSPLDAGVLRARLAGASSYDRIAGYFRSSLFEIGGRSWNAKQDQSASSAIPIWTRGMSLPLRLRSKLSVRAGVVGNRRTCPRPLSPASRLSTAFSRRRRMQVKVLPDEVFGLIHGKAGLIRYPDGRATTFLGSVNESATAWKLNYELLWEDDSPEAIAWVAEELKASGTTPTLSTLPVALSWKRISSAWPSARSLL